MNIRKLLCSLFRRGRWLYRLFDCKRYEEPEGPEYISVEVCLESETLPNAYCLTRVWQIFPADETPTTVCQIHKPPPPPPPQPKLDPHFEYFKTGRQFTAFFPACALINHTEYSEKDFFDFIDKIAEENLSNVLRFFPYGVWIPGDFTRQVVNFPHPGNPIDGFDIEKINPIWEEQVRKRLAYIRNAGIIPDLVLHDNCQYHNPDPWHHHWLYRDNNSGFQGLPTHWIHEVNCHFQEFSYIERGHWDQYYPGITSESELGPTDYQDMLGCRATENYYKWWDNWFIDMVRSEMGDDFRLSINEAEGAHSYHSFLYDHIFKLQEIPKNRLYSSFNAIELENYICRAEWYWVYRDNIFDKYRPDVHGINSPEKYNRGKEYKDFEGTKYHLILPGHHNLISTDGTGRWPEVVDGQVVDWRHGEREALTDAVYADGNDLEVIEWIWDGCSFAQLDWEGARKQRDRVLPYL